MKTSNKLLIAFAAALILLPLLGMIVVSRVYYKEGQRTAADFATIKSLDTETKHLTNFPTSAFRTVNIPEAESIRLNIYLVKDDQFGIKVSNHIKDRVSVNVDANGQLQINFKKNDASGSHRDYVSLYVFSPNVNSLSLSNADETIFNIEQDSIQLSLKGIENVYFENTKLKNLKATAEQVQSFTLNDARLTLAQVNLNNASFSSHGSSYEQLIVNSIGKGDVEIWGGRREEGKTYTVKNLRLQTGGQSKVAVGDIVVDRCAGAFSDSTQVEMPAALLNKMYSKN